MIGLVQKALAECLLDTGGDALRRAVYRKVGVPEDRVYRLDQGYPDIETGRMLEATTTLTGLGTEEVYTLLSRSFVRLVSDVFPGFLTLAKNSEDLIRTQAKIQALVAAGLQSERPHAPPVDKFQLEEDVPHQITLHYRSERPLCGLYKRLVQDLVDLFGDTMRIETLACRKSGADACRFCLRWTSVAGEWVVPDAASLPQAAPMKRRA